jgi:hypothetical protein
MEMARWLWRYVSFNQLVGGIVGATIASQIHSIIKYGPTELISIIGNYLPSSSNFFLNIVMFRALVFIPLKLLIPHPAARFYILRYDHPKYALASCFPTFLE